MSTSHLPASSVLPENVSLKLGGLTGVTVLTGALAPAGPSFTNCSGPPNAIECATPISERSRRMHCRINAPCVLDRGEGASSGSNRPPQNKTSQTRLSAGTLVEQPLPRKFVQEHSSDGEGTCEWHERATRILNVFAGLRGLPPASLCKDYRSGKTFFLTL